MRSLSVVSNFRRGSLCKRLWICGSCLAVFLSTIVIGNWFLPREKSVTREMLGHDFLAFYTAGSFVRTGHARDLYNLDAVKSFEQATAHQAGLEVGKSFGPWWNPPFYALVFEPLAMLPYPQALDVWRWISFASVVLAIGLLAQLVMRPSLAVRWQHGLLVPLLIVISMPFIQAISHGQNTFTSLLLLTMTVMLWRNQRRFWAGFAGGFLFFKPQLGAVVAAAMVLDLGWITLCGFGVTGLFLLAVTVFALPGTMGDWLHQLPTNVRWMQVEHAYLWERHVTLKAFWRLLLQGREAGEAALLTTMLTWFSLTALAGSLGVIAFKRWRAGDLHRDRLITATITAMPLLMPFYFDYDLLLLAIPVTLYAVERIKQPGELLPQDRWFTLSWVMLFAWLFVNPAFALHTHVSGTVILLTVTSALSIRRLNRQEKSAGTILVIGHQQLATAA